MAEHTAGPWKFSNVMPGEPAALGGTRLVEAPYDSEPQTIAFVHPSSDDTDKFGSDERDANARLIAAAPDLLAAAKEAAMALGNGLAPTSTRNEQLHARDALIAAIARATGGKE